MSSPDIQRALCRAVLKLLRPLVRTLLRNGVPYGAFADLAKCAYVEVAMNDLHVPGRRPTVSRAATITGLSRKEVSRVLEIGNEDDRDMVARYNRAARVVYGWVHDPVYSDAAGNTAVLPFEGPGATFSALVKEHSGDVPPRAIMDELIHVGVAERTDDGRLRLLARAYIPTRGEAEKLALLGRDVAGLIATMDKNIHRLGDKPFFQRKVFYDNMTAESVVALQAMLAQEGQQFLERLDQWMAQHDRDANPAAQGTGRKAAGIGLYYFEEDVFQESSL